MSIVFGDCRAATQGQGRLGNSAFDLKVHGMSGTTPKPFQAICNSARYATARYARTPACAPSQAPFFRRRTRTPSARSGYAFGTSLSLNRATAFPSCADGRGCPALGSVCASRGLSGLRARAGICPNKRASGSRPWLQKRNFRIRRKCGGSPCPLALASIERRPRISKNKTDSPPVGRYTVTYSCRNL